MNLDSNKIIAALLAALLAACGWWLKQTASEVRELRIAVTESRIDLQRTATALEFYLQRQAPKGAPEEP